MGNKKYMNMKHLEAMEADEQHLRNPVPSRLTASPSGAAVLWQGHADVHPPNGQLSPLPGRLVDVLIPVRNLSLRGKEIAGNRHIRSFCKKQSRKALVFFAIWKTSAF